MQFIDTHCHIHSADYKLDPTETILNAQNYGVNKMICVGTDVSDSKLAAKFVRSRPNTWASIGLHPHDAKLGRQALVQLKKLAKEPKIVAIGECGLDYFYNHSVKEDQVKALEFQIELAVNNKLPLIFHIRDAFDDFWPIFDNFKGLRGVVHSFTATKKELEAALKRDLYIGLNGIMSFTKDQRQLQAAKAVPLNRLLLETDAPFLTPVPLRGKINQPNNIVLIAEFLAQLRSEELGKIAVSTTNNAKNLFGI